MNEFSLSNGMRVLFAPSKGTDTVTVLVLVRVGSRYEYPKVNGASHFIEHLMFKGTKRRPNAQVISRILDSVGADFNAFTDKHVTGYYVKVDKNHLETAVDLLEDMIFHSKFDTQELNRERKVVIEEINMYRDTPARHVEDLLEEILFSKNTLGWNIAGSPESMKAMPKEEILAYHSAYYRPSNMVLVVAGNIDRKAKGLIEKKFGKNKDTRLEGDSFEPFETQVARPLVERVNVQYKDTAQVQVAFGFPSYGIQDEKNVVVRLLSVILGGNMSSRLFTEVREKKGLAYSVGAGNYLYDDVGAFSIRAGLDRTRMPLAVKTILTEVKKMAKDGVTTQELKEAKTYVHGQVSIRMEDSQDRAQWFANQLMFQDRVTVPATYLKRIDAVTQAQLAKVAKELLDTEKMCLAVIGPYKDTSEFLSTVKL